jgi:tRNA(Ile)-lysidine synthase
MAADAAGDWAHAAPDTAFFDMAALRFPLTVRNVLPGDRFTPLGLNGTQKLKAFFINNKVPRAARIRCPLVLSGNEIIWVAGHRIADSVKVTGSSKNLFKVQLLLA